MVETLELVTDELEDKKDDTKVTLVSAATSNFHQGQLRYILYNKSLQ